MIDSALFSRNTALDIGEEWKTELADSEKLVNKSTLYHLILSFANMINQDHSLLKIEKMQIVAEFGFTLGKNITEEESLGNIKYFLAKAEKDKARPYLGEFKFLSIKIWPSIFGSVSKLFAVVGEGGGYKLEDRDFGLTKWQSGEEERVRSLRKLLLELSKGVLQGFLDKFQLMGDVSYSEVSDNYVNFEMKALSKKTKTAFK